MRKLVRLGCVGAGAVFVMMLTGGCSTVLLTNNNETERSMAVEREALIDAAAQVSRTKWRKPQPASWRARLTGVADGGGSRISNSDAAATYVASLGAVDNRNEIVLNDAQRHLQAARNLVKAAGAAAEAIRPAMADVSVVEGAIGDLRQTRDIYLTSLKILSREGDDISDNQSRDMKRAFNDAIETIGAAADVLADRVAQDRTETFAGPGARQNLSGSL